MRRFLLPFLALSPPTAAMAQSGPDPIVITAEGLPETSGSAAYGAVSIGRERILQTPGTRFEYLLGDVAGLQQFRRSDSRSANPTAQGLNARSLGGNASTRTLVLLDGVPITDPFFGYVPFSQLVPDTLQEVRVTRGGGSGAFGAGALAGTVELESAPPGALPPLSARAAYGSRDSRQAAAVLSGKLGSGAASAFASYDGGDGFFTAPADQRGPADVPAAYESIAAGIRGGAPIGASSALSVSARLFRDDRTLRFDGADSRSEGEDVSLRVTRQAPWAVDALAYVQRRGFSNRVISSSNFNLVLDQRSTPSTGYGGKIEIRPPVGPAAVLRLGADIRGATGELYEDAYSAATGARTEARNGGGRNLSGGLFAEGDLTAGDVTLTAGLRGDLWRIENGFYTARSPQGVTVEDARYPDRSGEELTARAGIRWAPNPALALRAAAYTGYRLPTLNELYRPFVVFPVVTQANADLDTERLRGGEVGLDAAPLPGVRLTATVFWNELRDAIANVTVAENLRQRRNVDAIEAKGAELGLSAEVGVFDLRASYAYSDARVRGTGAAAALDGFRPSQSPAHSLSATLGAEPRQGARLSATLRHVGAQFEDDRQENRLPPATTIDLFAAWPLGQGVSLVGRAENLLDETIITRDTGEAIDLGTPRTLWLGLRYSG